MPTVTIRQLTPEEAPEVMYPLTSYAFSASPPLRDKAEFMASASLRRGATCVAAIEDDLPVAVVAATAMTQNVRGALFGSSAIWGIASHPAARRQGYVRDSMAVMLTLTAGRHVGLDALPVSRVFLRADGLCQLHPAACRQVRPGSASAAAEAGSRRAHRMAIDRRRLRRLSRLCHPGARPHARDGSFRSAGERGRDPAQRELGGVGEGRRRDGGAMLYNLRDKGDAGRTLDAFRFYSDTSQGRYLLLQWIARHADQAGQAELRLRPTECRRRGSPICGSRSSIRGGRWRASST